MKARYLLPCSCGREIPVEPSQAGQMVACSCGGEMEVPTLLRLSKLKRAPEAETPVSQPQKRWGLRQRLLLLGAMIVIPFLGLAGWGYGHRPRSEEVFTYRPLETLSYAGVWQIWQDLRLQGVARHATEAESQFGLSVQYYRLWMGCFLGMSVLGVLMILSALFVSPPQASRSRPAVPARR